MSLTLSFYTTSDTQTHGEKDILTEQVRGYEEQGGEHDILRGLEVLFLPCKTC